MATTPSSSPQMTNSQISSKGILVKLNISQWTANRKDNDVTTATNANFGASKDAGHYQKFLVSKSSLRDVNRAASKARKFHYERTLPWGDDGERILAADMVMDYTRGMRDCRHEFDFAVREFVNKYPGLIIDSQQSLGKMFNSAEYPTTSEVLNRFKLDTHMRPVPISDDFRIKITEAEASRIKAKLDAENQTLIKDAMQDVWDRLYNSVKMMADRLGEKDKSFKRSTVENVATQIGRAHV